MGMPMRTRTIFAAHLVKLARQAHGPQAGVQNAGDMKRNAVGTFEEHGHHRGAGTKGEARCRRFPWWVGDGMLCPIEMSDLARGKHDQIGRASCRERV